MLLKDGWLAIGRTYQGRQRFWAEIWLLVLVGPLPTVLLPAIVDNRPFNTGILMFSAHNSGDACEMTVLSNVLNFKGIYGDKPLNIMNMIDQGPELLFRSPHTIMSAPYHTNVRGNLESFRFFRTHDPEEARKIAEKNKIDLIVMCRAISTIYTETDNGRVRVATMGEDGKPMPPPDANFAEQLIYNKKPDWLREAHFPMLDKFMIFEVKTSFPDKPRKDGDFTLPPRPEKGTTLLAPLVNVNTDAGKEPK
jgi:hypothetical protein